MQIHPNPSTSANIPSTTNNLNLGTAQIDWNAPNVIQQILRQIQNPLDAIVKASQKANLLNNTQSKMTNNSQLILTHSQQIADLIEGIVAEMESRSVTITEQHRPKIFSLYQNNRNIQSLCTDTIKLNRISKTDQRWLMNFESEVLDQVKSSQLNLMDLSFKLAISERQLHRKIKALLFLTPNKYIRILKLHKAKELLDQYVYDTVSEIAYAVGYYDTHYFSKIFCQQYDQSPRALLLEKR